MNRGLKRAILASILIHLLMLFPLRQLAWLPEFSSQVGNKSVDVLLRAAERVHPESAPFEHSSETSEKPLPGSREILNRPAKVIRTPVLPSFSRSTVTDDVAVTNRAAVLPAPAKAATGAADAKAEQVDLDGVRQYRLNLAREARQLKNYPDLARERGWEGVVVVIVTTVAGARVPQVSLSQSSGSDVLDRAATELMELAVQTASLPESLRGHQFALTLPIHYRLSD
jgi:periplasmic protein TonB